MAAGTAPAPEKKTRRQIRAEEAAAAAAAKAAAEAPPAPEAPAAATGGRPIQVASFSKEENARRATEALAKIGITAQPQKSERDGKAVWGVVAVGDAALLDKIKAAGFADAFFLQ
nr:SPOR domain-containing protein [Tabrizicola aquatica]